jgi:hypothetical protein
MCLSCSGDFLPGREFSCTGQKCELPTATLQGTPIFNPNGVGDCTPCDTSCEIGKCTGNGTSRDCTACPAGSELSIPGNSCNPINPLTCAANQFIKPSADFSSSTCEDCELNCKTCEYSGARRCLSCDPPLFLLHYRPEQGGGKDCVASCPIDNSTYNIGSECKLPVSNCALFDQSNGSCTTCNKGYFLRLDGSLNSCAKTPAQGKYYDALNIERSCPVSCPG